MWNSTIQMTYAILNSLIENETQKKEEKGAIDK